MRIYFAGPLFSAAERDWNAALAGTLRGAGHSGYNPMLTESATIRVDAVAAPIDRVAREVLDALARLDAAPGQSTGCA